jgi:hypothetical protein
MKLPNKEVLAASAEVVEGRARSKENATEPHPSPTQSGEPVSQGLRGVREVARVSKREKVHVSAASCNDRIGPRLNNPATGPLDFPWALRVVPGKGNKPNPGTSPGSGYRFINLKVPLVRELQGNFCGEEGAWPELVGAGNGGSQYLGRTSIARSSCSPSSRDRSAAPRTVLMPSDPAPDP